MSDFEEFKLFKRNLEEGTSKFAEIALKSLKENVKVAKHGLNGVYVKPPFCAYPGVCELKKLRMVYYSRGKKRRYQLCASSEGCNQRCEKPMYYEV